MDFGEVLTKAWKIIWKYKILWLFGIFASCSGSGGNGGGGGGGGSSANYSGNMGPGYYDVNIEPWALALIVAAVILLIILLIVIAISVSTVGRIGLIQGTQQADEDDDAQLTFRGLFNSGKPFFWRILGLNLLILVGYIALGIAIAIVIVLMFMTVCLIPLACILIPVLVIVFWVLASFVEMANVAVVTEDLNVIEGIQRGWQVFKDNLIEMVLMGLVLILGGFIVNMLLAIPIVIAMIPFMMGVFAAIFGDSNAMAAGSVIFAGICCVAYLPVLIVIGGIVRAYIGAAWTLTYLRLTKGSAVDEPVELLPDEPVEPEVLPEADVEPTTEEVAEPEKPAKSEDILPDDF